MSKILTQAQAEAVYNAMRELNNVGGWIDTLEMACGERRVRQTNAGRVIVESIEDGEEHYFDQCDFATAYGLNSDEWQSDVSAAAGGLTQTAIER